jgi:dCMP deaminase
MRDSKDTYFVKMLEDVCSRSTCVRRSVGAILTDARGRILSSGYNGPPSGFEHCVQEHPCPGARDVSGDTRRCLAVHAEQNCLLQCWRLDLASTLYVTCTPCFTCAKMILQTDISRVVVTSAYADDGGVTLLVQKGKLWVYDYESRQATLLAGDVTNRAL